MGKKFKINDHVRIKATGEFGTVKGRDVIPVDGTKRVNIEYIVKTANGFSNWRAYTKNELEAVCQKTKDLHEYVKVYDVVDGFKITIYAKVDTINNNWIGKYRSLRIGFAIYSPEDEYSDTLGVRIARKRSRVSPFCSMNSSFSGEFNAATVEAIMDAKADYIKNNFGNFINRKKK